MYIYTTFSFKEGDLKDSDELTNSQSQVEQIRLEDKLIKQGFHYDTKKNIFEPTTKAVTDTSQKLVEETKINTKAIEYRDESNKYVKTLELMNKDEKIHPSLIRPIAKLLVPKNRS